MPTADAVPGHVGFPRAAGRRGTLHRPASRARLSKPLVVIPLDVEAHRAGRRLGLPADVVADLLDAVTLFAPSEGTFAAARDIGPDTLRTPDALHLAAALELGADLDAVVTYDRRLAAGCVAVGFDVQAPGLADGWWETPS